MRKSFGRSAAIFAAAAAVLAASCSDKPGDGPLSGLDSSTDTTRAATPTTVSADVASPLTGGSVAASVAARPAVIVKVDNSPQARPQAGLNAADVIYEERVEGSVVRFLAVYQSEDATIVGPVRSVRSTDAAVVAPIGGVFAFSGGITPFRNKIEATGIKTVAESDDPSLGNSKRAGKVRPYATYANTVKLRAQAKPGAPPSLFIRSQPGAAFATVNANATRTVGMKVVFGSLTTADWAWDAKLNLWLRSTNGTPHVLEDRSRLSTDCIILQTVPYRPTPYTDRADFAVDEAVITGSGNALVACDGHSVVARWQKSSPKAVTTYTNVANGTPVQLPIGRVWVSLVPTNGSITLQTPVALASTTTRPR